MNITNKKILNWSLAILMILVLIGLAVVFYRSFNKTTINNDVQKNTDDDIITFDGLHWHPILSIYIKGKKEEIPASIGLSEVSESPIHTHDNSGVIHLEFLGTVKKGDTKLGNFFKVWGKRFDKNCIFDYCSGVSGTLKMFVNNKENFDFENYYMQDQDNIEIKFE